MYVDDHIVAQALTKIENRPGAQPDLSDLDPLVASGVQMLRVALVRRGWMFDHSAQAWTEYGDTVERAKRL